MLQIFIAAQFGNVVKQVEIRGIPGVHSNTYDVMIDNYYNGRIWITEHYGWRNDIKLSSELTTFDIEYIIDLIENYNEH